MSVYQYSNRMNTGKYGDADYSTAVIDRVFIDTDSFYGYECMKVLNWKLCELGIVHRINYSGRFTRYGMVKRAIGYHVYIFVSPHLEYPKNALTNFQDFLNEFITKAVADEFFVKDPNPIDPATIGDTARMSRFPNTFNKKWNRWCIPITQDEIDEMSPYDICRLGKKARLEEKDWWLGGDKIYEIPSKHDVHTLRRHGKLVEGIDPVDAGDLEKFRLPQCVINMTSNPYLDYNERFWFVVCLREKGLLEEEVVQILGGFLDVEFFEHCVYGDEEIVRRVFRGRQRDAYFTGGCPWMQQRGYCSERCDRTHPVYL